PRNLAANACSVRLLCNPRVFVIGIPRDSDNLTNLTNAVRRFLQVPPKRCIIRNQVAPSPNGWGASCSFATGERLTARLTTSITRWLATLSQNTSQNGFLASSQTF